ncbi:MAG: hypothetical protein ACJ761_08185 [Chloroflexota bacterium]
MTKAKARAVDKPAASGKTTTAVPSGDGESRTPGIDVEGDRLAVAKGRVDLARVGHLEVRQGAVGRADAEDVAVTQGAIGLARGERVSVELGAIGLAVASEAHVTQGVVRSIIGRDVHIEQGAVQTVVADHVSFARSTPVLVVIARRVDGEVRALLDWRGAIAFGAAFGAVFGLLRRRR